MYQRLLWAVYFILFATHVVALAGDLTSSKINPSLVNFDEDAQAGQKRRVQINQRRFGPLCKSNEFVSDFAYNEDDDDDHINALYCQERVTD